MDTDRPGATDAHTTERSMRYSLNGSWKIRADTDDIGVRDRWFDGPPRQPDATTAIVPAYAQQALPDVEGIFWYWREFYSPPRLELDRAVVQFDAVDYHARVWVNGVFVGAHEGGETPFELDVTSTLAESGTNAICVQVTMPTVDGRTGFTLAEVPHRNRQTPFWAGASWNTGGITGSVHLQVLPALHLEATFVDASPTNPDVVVRTEVSGLHEVTPATIAVTLTDDSSTGEHVVYRSGARHTVVRPGEPLTISCRPADLQPWSLQSPRLYRATVFVTVRGSELVSSVRFGVRDFRLVEGRFELNGQPLFLRMTHTVNDYPWINDPDATLAQLRQDLVHLKACGFSMVRFIWGDARPEQLDLCDQIGLLVYEETFASWPLSESDQLETRMHAAIHAVVRRDRNHPSVVVWGLLNEAHDGGAVDVAAGMLSDLVDLDGTRMVALNSGRWDTRSDLASFANPGSTAWDGRLGDEGVERPADCEVGWQPLDSSIRLGHNSQWAGDVHPYPVVPHTAAVIDYLRRIGSDCARPIFVTEYGVGSAVDLWRAARHFEETDRARAQDAAFYEAALSKFMVDWKRWRLEDVFGHPAAFYEASSERTAGERVQGIDALRSNPHVTGYGLTGAVDQVMCGEGLANTFRELKPHTIDAIGAALGPSRLCVFATPQNVAVGSAVRLEVLLSTDRELAAGMPVSVQIWGPDGARQWSTTAVTRAALPRSGSQTVMPVIDERWVAASVPGTYIVRAFLDGHAAATTGSATIHVMECQAPASRHATVVGDDTLAKRLVESGVVVEARTWTDGPAAVDDPVIWPSSTTLCQENVAEFRRVIHAGGSVLCFDGATFDALAGIDARGRDLKPMRSWLYQRDDWVREHPIFGGLRDHPLLSWDRFRELITERVYRPTSDDSVQAVAGAIRASQNYDSGLTVWLGTGANGRLVGCTYAIDAWVGNHPVADHLMANVLDYLSNLRSGT